MPNPLIRYQLDPTGTNPDNAVEGEIHNLSIAQIRAVAPIYGPFFTESLIVYDDLTNRLLFRGQHYQVVELLQDASLKFGKEIAQLILILDQTVSSIVRISYQTLGGLYQNNASGIVNMYETIMHDQRPVDWINVLNKPSEYPPTLHRHLLEDVYGFEPVVIALERIRNAIILSDVPAFEALIDWVNSRMATVPTVTEAEIDGVISVNKYVTFERLLYALDKLNFNAITLEPTLANIPDGGNKHISVSTTNFPDNTVLYWTIEHNGTNELDFNLLSGVINIVGNRGGFNISLAANPSIVEGNETFRILIRKNGINGPILAKTGLIIIDRHGVDVTQEMNTYLNTCCLYKPNLSINPISMHVIGCLSTKSHRGLYVN